MTRKRLALRSATQSSQLSLLSDSVRACACTCMHVYMYNIYIYVYIYVYIYIYLFIYLALVRFWAHILLKNLIFSPVL